MENANLNDQLDKQEREFVNKFLAVHFYEVCKQIYGPKEVESWDKEKHERVKKILVKNHLEYQQGFRDGFLTAKNYYLNPQRN